MPILGIEVVQSPDDSISDEAIQGIADSSSEIFGTKAGRTWVKLHRFNQTDYAENGRPNNVLKPVFDSVLKAEPPMGEELKTEIMNLTKIVALAFGRPLENVHVSYAPAAKGRVSFGGKLV